MNWRLNYISQLTGGYWTPHTAIICTKDYTGVELIESSWYTSGVVSSVPRYVTFNDFYKKVFIDYTYKYTIYTIL